MARRKRIELVDGWKELIEGDKGFRVLLQGVVQEVLEAEMDEALGAGKWERSEGQLGYRAGYYGRTLMTRCGYRRIGRGGFRRRYLSGTSGVRRRWCRR